MADCEVEDSNYHTGKDDMKWGYEDGKSTIHLELEGNN